jgi:LuxR family maltose regulon positive regulatory protein
MLMGGGSDSAVLKRAIGELINDVMKYDEPLTLVLDDLHLVTEPAAYVVLEYLLSHLPPQMHLAVGTRHDPPLRLARLAPGAQVLELRRPDLGFSEVEARELLIKSLGIELSHADVEALQERTEGCPRVSAYWRDPWPAWVRRPTGRSSWRP